MFEALELKCEVARHRPAMPAGAVLPSGIHPAALKPRYTVEAPDPMSTADMVKSPVHNSASVTRSCSALVNDQTLDARAVALQ